MFFIEKNGKYGRRGTCNECDAIRHLLYKESHKEQARKKRKIYCELNKEKISYQNKKHKLENNVKSYYSQLWKHSTADCVVGSALLLTALQTRPADACQASELGRVPRTEGA